jgi:hypothetical protein
MKYYFLSDTTTLTINVVDEITDLVFDLSDSNISELEKIQLLKLLEKYKDIFSVNMNN